MRYSVAILAVLLFASVAIAQQQGAEPAPSLDAKPATTTAPVRSEFHVRYVNGTNVYIDAGRDAGLVEGTALVLKQSTSNSADGQNAAVEPGIIAKLQVVAVASSSAVCEVKSTTRDISPGDSLSLPDAEVEKMVVKNTLGNTRKYPMVISFTAGDPLDEEVREKLPRPPLPEINQIRGRIGFDVSVIQQLGQFSSSSKQYGMIFRADAPVPRQHKLPCRTSSTALT